MHDPINTHMVDKICVFLFVYLPQHYLVLSFGSLSGPARRIRSSRQCRRGRLTGSDVKIEMLATDDHASFEFHSYSLRYLTFSQALDRLLQLR